VATHLEQRLVAELDRALDRIDAAGEVPVALMNPTATEADVAALVALVARAGAALDRPGQP
jgi:hypothetical protein